MKQSLLGIKQYFFKLQAGITKTFSYLNWSCMLDQLLKTHLFDGTVSVWAFLSRCAPCAWWSHRLQWKLSVITGYMYVKLVAMGGCVARLWQTGMCVFTTCGFVPLHEPSITHIAVFSYRRRVSFWIPVCAFMRLQASRMLVCLYVCWKQCTFFYIYRWVHLCVTETSKKLGANEVKMHHCYCLVLLILFWTVILPHHAVSVFSKADPVISL